MNRSEAEGETSLQEAAARAAVLSPADRYMRLTDLATTPGESWPDTSCSWLIDHDGVPLQAVDFEEVDEAGVVDSYSVRSDGLLIRNATLRRESDFRHLGFVKFSGCVRVHGSLGFAELELVFTQGVLSSATDRSSGYKRIFKQHSCPY